MSNSLKSQHTETFKIIGEDLQKVETKLQEELCFDNELIQQVLNYVISAGGKRIRPALAILAGRAIQQELQDQHYKIAEIAEMIHTATLMHDDVIDSAGMRRGLSTVNTMWNNKIAVIAGDYLLSLASIRLASLGNLEVVDIFANVLKEICIGEIQQDLDRFNTRLTWDQYLKKSVRKTATLFAATTKSAAIVSQAPPEIENALNTYGIKLGLVFQLADDLLNVTGNTTTVGKYANDDLKNGIITACTLYALETDYKQDIVSFLESQFTQSGSFEAVVEMIHQSGAIEKTQQLIDTYVDEAVTALDILQNSIYKDELIKVAYYAGNREK